MIGLNKASLYFYLQTYILLLYSLTTDGTKVYPRLIAYGVYFRNGFWRDHRESKIQSLFSFTLSIVLAANELIMKIPILIVSIKT